MTSRWSKLELLYMFKSLTYRQFLKQQLYSFRMVELKPLVDQLTYIHRLVDDLEKIKVNIDDKDKTLFLWYSSHRFF